MQAYRFQDEKSDKFWRVEYAGNAYAVNYGKTGTTGQYKLKEFAGPEECEKETKKLIEEHWDMTYIPPDDISRETVERLAREDEMNLTQSDMVTYAVAFAQIKITGRVDAKLKTMAQNAMRRTEITADVLGWNTTGKPSEVTARMLADLETFPAG